MKIVVTSVFVDDQEKAVQFYTNVLGFTKKHDVPLGQNMRWLTVVSPGEPNGVELLLEPANHPAVAPFRDALVGDGIPWTSFGVGRSFFRSAFNPPTGDVRAAATADLTGANVRIPAGTTITGGMTFTGTLADGSTFSGVVQNSIGAGWTFLDGYGFINAQSAVAQPLP